MKSSAQLKREERTRKREQGFTLKQIWVYPECWESIQKYIAKKLKVEQKKAAIDNAKEGEG